MKTEYIKFPILTTALFLMGNAIFAQTNVVNRVNVNLLRSIVELESSDSTKEKNLILEINPQDVKDMSKVFIKVGTSPRRGDIMINFLDMDVLTGNKAIEKVKVKEFKKDKLKIDMGPLETGTYFLTFRVMDKKNDMYLSEQILNVE